MRTLQPPPTSLFPDTPFGSFRGGLPKLDFGPIPKNKLWQLVHAKRWTYVAVADDRVFAAMAVVSLTYAATAIVFVLDRASGQLLVDKSILGPGTAATFEDDGDGRRRARFKLGRTRISLGDDHVRADLEDGRPVHIDFRPSGSGPSPISAVVPIAGGYANATEKRLFDARGEVVAGNRRYLLSDARSSAGRPALAAYDHTAGYLARHTAWRWALGLGYAASGERVAFNLVEGFVGEPECAGWVGDQLFPLGEGRFEFDAERPGDPWRIRTTCGALDLTFRPAAVHAEAKNLIVIRSSFVQPVGAFEGTLTLGDRRLTVRDLPGVTEHQDVLW